MTSTYPATRAVAVALNFSEATARDYVFSHSLGRISLGTVGTIHLEETDASRFRINGYVSIGVGIGIGRFAVGFGLRSMGPGISVTFSRAGSDTPVHKIDLVTAVFVVMAVMSAAYTSVRLLHEVIGRGARRVRSGLNGCGHKESRGGANAWAIQVLAELMPPHARERWLDDIAETLHDFAPDLHTVLTRDFLAHAPAVIVRSWTIELSCRLLGGSPSLERPDDHPGR